jgi:hypothetical protein
VVKLVAANQLTLENVTQGTSGTINANSYVSANRIYVSGVTWNTGDVWRIKNYPSNRMYSLGPFAMIVKTFKTSGLEFYVKARTVGAGKSYSDYVSGDTTEGSETMPVPENFTAQQKYHNPLIRRYIYWVQDIPYVDILLEWDDLDPEYGWVTYEIRETIEGEEGEDVYYG